MSKMRLFVAADIPAEVRRLLSDMVEEVRYEIEGARWVKAGNLHLTLKFIGEREDDSLERLKNEIRVAAERGNPFSATLGGCGAFPSPGKARVIWVGMEEGVEEAAKVAGKLDSRLAKAGVERDKRRFRGHLTLARLRKPRNCAALLNDMEAKLKGLSGMPFPVAEVVLYRSVLGPQGPTYTALESFKLGGTRE